jgi:hypothetical protein
MLSTLLGWRLGGVRENSQVRALGLTRTKDILLEGAAFNTLGHQALGQTPPEAALALRLLRFKGNGCWCCWRPRSSFRP